VEEGGVTIDTIGSSVELNLEGTMCCSVTFHPFHESSSEDEDVSYFEKAAMMIMLST
jgi:hypothetical protein